MAEAEHSILIAFLRSPSSRDAFNVFYDLTYRLTCAHLRRLSFQGYRLPIDDRTDADPVADLAVDVLAEILAPVGGFPCPGLFAYLRRQGFEEFRGENGEFIYLLFTAFLRRQISQQLSRLRKDRSPQIENLKRRIKDIAGGAEFCQWIDPATGHSLVAPADSRIGATPVGPIVSREQLRLLVQQAFAASTSRQGWCREIFRLLGELPDFPPAVYLHDLLSLMVEVNARFLDSEEFAPAPLPGPCDTFLQKAIETARCRAVHDTYASTIQRFIQSRRIRADEGERFRQALDAYLTDVSAGDGHDKVPDYFREVLPEAYPRYLADYKYVFEATLAKGEQRFREILRDDPTIGAFGDYPFVGE